MAEVVTHDFKDLDLAGGTLIVSVPHQGAGNILLTDFLLANMEMDHTAGMDSPDFPPVATLRQGRGRFPVRIHATEAAKIAVLRCEFTPPPFLARPMAGAILEWARRKRIARLVTLDAVFAMGPDAKGPGAKAGRRKEPRVLCVASRKATLELAVANRIPTFDGGAIGGVQAMMLLMSQVQDTDYVGLLAILEDVHEDVQSAEWFARALPIFVPSLPIDMTSLRREINAIAHTVRDIQEQFQKVVDQMRTQDKQAPPVMYR